MTHCRGTRLAESWTASTTDVPALVQQLDGYRRWAKPVLEAELAQKPAPDATADAQDRLAQRQARAAGGPSAVGDKARRCGDLLCHIPDPSVRSYIVNWLKSLGAGPKALMTRLESLAEESGFDPEGWEIPHGCDPLPPRKTAEPPGADPGPWGVRQAYDLFPHRTRAADARNLLEAYRTDPDAGVHGAAEWTLRRWKQEETLKKVDAELQSLKDRGNRRWYVNSEGQTLAMIQGPVEFSMGIAPQ